MPLAADERRAVLAGSHFRGPDSAADAALRHFEGEMLR